MHSSDIDYVVLGPGQRHLRVLKVVVAIRILTRGWYIRTQGRGEVLGCDLKIHLFLLAPNSLDRLSWPINKFWANMNSASRCTSAYYEIFCRIGAVLAKMNSSGEYE